MSIPSTDHTIYSFITLCLKEQGDIAGRMEITTKQGGEESEKKWNTIIDRDVSLWQVYDSGAGTEGGWLKRMSRSTHTPPPPTFNTHLCIIPSLTKCSAGQNFICDRFASRHALLEVMGRTGGGGGLEWREADCKKERSGGRCLFHHRVMSSSGPGRCFFVFTLWSDKWLIVSLDKGTVFPLMGSRERRNSLKYRPSESITESSWMQKACLL